ncbi:MAG TPA: pyruvate formate lyase family protein [Myxococcales bacterium]|jgi:formate C-acetyltransferase
MQTTQAHLSVLAGGTSQDESASGLDVLKIQRTCVHDGPGVRTTIFFRGCNLRCLWCQNPEALQADPGTPAEKGPSLEEILEVVGRDREYYRSTGGGVTLSGGDPLVQGEESLVRLLTALKDRGLHVAVETSLHAPARTVARVAPLVDLFLVDLKVVGDDVLHRRLTGQSGTLVASNLRRLVELKANLRFRTVVVPGLNDSEQGVRATAELLRSLGFESIELLEYHDLHVDKARRLSIERASLGLVTPAQSQEAVNVAVARFRAQGIAAHCTALGGPRRRASFSPRVHAIRDAIRQSDYHLCLESSKLKTRFYRKHGFGQPTPIHRARRLAYVLEHKQIAIHPQELLFGNFTAQRVGAQVWEEHFGALLILLLHKTERLAPVSFQCSWKDRLAFYTEIFPFWARHGLLTKVNPTLKGLLQTLARCAEMRAGFNNNLAAIAHFVVNFERILTLGTTGIAEEIRRAQRENPENDQDFYRGALIALEGLEAFAQRYSDHLARLATGERDPARRRELEEGAAACARVPRLPARTYREALQSMLFLQIALCLESYENAVSLGRLDQILYPYFARDRAAGLLDFEAAKELLALFVLKMDEAILLSDGDSFLRIGRLFETQSTDQTVTAGGMGRDGKDATNDVTYMLLDICELQPLAVNMTARVHRDSPPEYLERLAEVYLTGAPMPALYNDHVYVDTLQRHYATTVEDARNYAIVGCVEPNASDDHFGNTDCANMNVALPFLQALRGDESDLWSFGLADQLLKLQTRFVEHSCRGDGRLARLASAASRKAVELHERRQRPLALGPPATMEELLERFQARLNRLAGSVLADHQRIEKALREGFTTPLASSLFKGCVERGRDAYDGGARLNSSGIQAVGITDVADSLHALEEVVFRQRLYRLEEVLAALDADFVGARNQEIRTALLAVPKFGDDTSRRPQEWMNRTLQIYVDALRSVPNCPRDGIYAAGYYALNVNIVYGLKTPALPSGRLRGVPLANSLTPHYGMKQADLLSALNSEVGVDFRRYAPNGTTVTFTIDSALFDGPEGVKNLAGIVKTYFDQGGMQFQPNVISREILLEAYAHPEKHPYLLVRIAGYCAYFNDLSDDLKKVIINRTCYA